MVRPSRSVPVIDVDVPARSRRRGTLEPGVRRDPGSTPFTVATSVESPPRHPRRYHMKQFRLAAVAGKRGELGLDNDARPLRRESHDGIRDNFDDKLAGTDALQSDGFEPHSALENRTL